MHRNWSWFDGDSKRLDGDYIHELTLLKSSKNAGFGQCGRGRGESSIKPDMA